MRRSLHDPTFSHFGRTLICDRGSRYHVLRASVVAPIKTVFNSTYLFSLFYGM